MWNNALVKTIGILEVCMNMKINDLLGNGFTSATADLCNRGACPPPWLWLCPRRVEPSQARWFYPVEEGSMILFRFPWNGDGGSNPGQMLIFFLFYKMYFQILLGLHLLNLFKRCLFSFNIKRLMQDHK